MTNQKIISLLKLTTTLLELHDTNIFKIKSIQSSIDFLENITSNLSIMSYEQLVALDKIGKSTASKIIEIVNTNTTQELTELLSQTPTGLLDIIQLKGIGIKKVRALWQELGVTSTQELVSACKENKVATLKGFGEKTQITILESIEFLNSNARFARYPEAMMIAENILEQVRAFPQIHKISITGAIARKCEITDTIDFTVATAKSNIENIITQLNQFSTLVYDASSSGPYVWRGTLQSPALSIVFYFTSDEHFESSVYIHTSATDHLSIKLPNHKTIFQNVYQQHFENEKSIFEKLQIPAIVAELREGYLEEKIIVENSAPTLLEYKDLKGVLHNHSQYSDGANTIKEMAMRCMALGFEYFGIADHSKSGNFYNGGMYEDKVVAQQKEIDLLNEELKPFKIFKGIEVDILADGSLDYADDVMASFDYVVASIHANLKMDIDKATARIIKAIEHPSNTILGHASGRLLLKREGYPLDYKKVIDACAANNVGIEINANPMRLDLDWRQVIYALEKNIWISINPDAHNLQGLEDMIYGVNIGRKAGLTNTYTLNAMSTNAIQEYFINRKKEKGLL
jgi:DNA polymerase (family 10)